ncbi:MAG: hypothetical protein MPN21_13280 [Thermoanaerobaculia bacterium]|nr:hypothetical protein [Thermoanaerobaculia bacterium]
MKVRFSDAARSELIEVAEFYDEQRGGLGIEFVHEVHNAVHRIFEFLRESEIFVVAVMDLRRDPVRWRDRV